MAKDVIDIMHDLDGGTFTDKAAKALAAVALMSLETQSKGSVTINFEMNPLKNSQQVQVKHTIKYTQPTPNGSRAETDSNTTLLYVGPKGIMTITPPDQADMFKTRSHKDEQ